MLEGPLVAWRAQSQSSWCLRTLYLPQALDMEARKDILEEGTAQAEAW